MSSLRSQPPLFETRPLVIEHRAWEKQSKVPYAEGEEFTYRSSAGAVVCSPGTLPCSLGESTITDEAPEGVAYQQEFKFVFPLTSSSGCA